MHYYLSLIHTHLIIIILNRRHYTGLLSMTHCQKHFQTVNNNKLASNKSQVINSKYKFQVLHVNNMMTLIIVPVSFLNSNLT